MSLPLRLAIALAIVLVLSASCAPSSRAVPDCGPGVTGPCIARIHTHPEGVHQDDYD